LAELRKICDEYGILLIADEIQTGVGRTGEFWAHTRSGITPDIMIMAKGIASGMPLSAIAASHELMDKWKPGSHGGTYGGGNSVVLAAAVETLRVVQEEKLVENARNMGDYLLESLKDLQQAFPFMGDVRGWGLMIGTEFTTNGKPDAGIATALQKYAKENRLLLLTCGTYGNVIRWIPPLIVKRKQIDDALAIFRRGLQTIVK
jgi:4-aminobutyrate aminotransferase